MAVSFPNVSRSYDHARESVLFWGYDGVIEKAFSIAADALLKIRDVPKCDEMGLLAIFDENRELIYTAAAKVYSSKISAPYHLYAKNF